MYDAVYNIIPTQLTIRQHLQTRLLFLCPKINFQNINMPLALFGIISWRERMIPEDETCQPPPQKVKKTPGSLTSIQKSSKISSLSQSPHDRLKKEMEKYIRIQTIDGDDYPLMWWKYACSFPLLSQLARKYLAIPASSSQRAQLMPDQANMLVFLAENS